MQISMISGTFFSEIEKTVSEIREEKSFGKPFGAIQLIVCGDFAQVG